VTHFYRIKRYGSPYFGQPCRVLLAGRGSVLIEFEDGYRMVTTRYGIRRLPKETDR